MSESETKFFAELCARLDQLPPFKEPRPTKDQVIWTFGGFKKKPMCEAVAAVLNSLGSGR